MSGKRDRRAFEAFVDRVARVLDRYATRQLGEEKEKFNEAELELMQNIQSDYADGQLHARVRRFLRRNPAFLGDLVKAVEAVLEEIKVGFGPRGDWRAPDPQGHRGGRYVAKPRHRVAAGVAGQDG
jgi:hypothetical protein